MLELSKGIRKSDSVEEYRPFFVAAKHLEQNVIHQRISKADGVEFTGMQRTISSLYALQASLDQALIVPTGFEVPIEYLPQKTTSAFLRSGSMSIQSRSRP